MYGDRAGTWTFRALIINTRGTKGRKPAKEFDVASSRFGINLPTLYWANKISSFCLSSVAVHQQIKKITIRPQQQRQKIIIKNTRTEFIESSFLLLLNFAGFYHSRDDSREFKFFLFSLTVFFLLLISVFHFIFYLKCRNEQ